MLGVKEASRLQWLRLGKVHTSPSYSTLMAALVCTLEAPPHESYLSGISGTLGTGPAA